MSALKYSKSVGKTYEEVQSSRNKGLPLPGFYEDFCTINLFKEYLLEHGVNAAAITSATPKNKKAATKKVILLGFPFFVYSFAIIYIYLQFVFLISNNLQQQQQKNADAATNTKVRCPFEFSVAELNMLVQKYSEFLLP